MTDDVMKHEKADINNIDCSFAIPIYQNEGTIMSTYVDIKGVMEQSFPSLTFEVIFVDDGSTDNSFNELVDLNDRYGEQIKIIKLTRNFGQPRARLAGIQNANGECVISLSADGQEPVELILKMLNARIDEGYEIVVCSRQSRDESLFRKVTSYIFYGLMRMLCFPNMPRGGFSYVLLGRKALNVILRNQDAYPFFQGQVLWTGFRIKFIPFHRPRRKVGHSSWTVSKKITLFIDGIFNYSFFPIRCISFIGIISAASGVFYAIMILVRKLTFGTNVQGWAALMFVVLIMGGLNLLMLGVIGEYIWRTLAQVRNRDAYVVDKIICGKNSVDSD